MKLTYDTIAKAARKVPDMANANALIVALNQYGERYGLLVPHTPAAQPTAGKGGRE